MDQRVQFIADYQRAVFDAPARSRGPGGRRGADTARLCAADRVQAHSDEPASDRGTRGDGAGRRGQTRARARRLVIGYAQPGGRPPWGARGRHQHRGPTAHAQRAA